MGREREVGGCDMESHGEGSLRFYGIRLNLKVTRMPHIQYYMPHLEPSPHKIWHFQSIILHHKRETYCNMQSETLPYCTLPTQDHIAYLYSNHLKQSTCFSLSESPAIRQNCWVNMFSFVISSSPLPHLLICFSVCWGQRLKAGEWWPEWEAAVTSDL